MPDGRYCDRCGAKSSPHIPRQRVGDQLWCSMCAQNHGRARVTSRAQRLANRGWTPAAVEAYERARGMVRVLPDGRIALASRLGDGRISLVAHDSGDGETIFHCPFCGSGQVIARSDGTVECEFCSTAFTVQVQPQMPAFPQTIDGVPVDVPGMPAGGANANVPPGAAPADPNDPNADPNADDGNPFASDDGDDGSGGDDPTQQSDDGSGDDSGGGSKPPWLNKKSSSRHYWTPAGNILSERQFMRHLAISHSPDRERVLAQVRRENGES